MSDLMIFTYVMVHHAVRRSARSLHIDERGEGVISAAIAVLIMAFLGAAMWVVFDRMFDKTADKTERQVDKIGE